MRSYYVYIMTNRSGTLYTGVTNDLQRRILEHREGLGGFTGKYRLVKLVYYEVADSAYAAISREKQIKGWTREKKLGLARGRKPGLKDLAPQLFGWRAGQFGDREAHFAVVTSFRDRSFLRQDDGRRLRAPVDFEDADGFVEALHGVLAAVGEEEGLAAAKLAHDVGGEDLAALGLGGDARGEDDGGAEEVAFIFDGLAGVEADAYRHRFNRRL